MPFGFCSVQVMPLFRISFWLIRRSDKNWSCSGLQLFGVKEYLRLIYRQKFVLPVFNRNFSKLLEFFLTYFGNLLDFFLIYVWWSLDYFWKKKCRLNKRAKKTHKNYILLPHHHPISLFEIWLYCVPKQQNIFFFFVFIEYARKHTLLDR